MGVRIRTAIRATAASSARRVLIIFGLHGRLRFAIRSLAHFAEPGEMLVEIAAQSLGKPFELSKTAQYGQQKTAVRSRRVSPCVSERFETGPLFGNRA
jgi:hypothetical protein